MRCRLLSMVRTERTTIPSAHARHDEHFSDQVFELMMNGERTALREPMRRVARALGSLCAAL